MVKWENPTGDSTSWIQLRGSGFRHILYNPTLTLGLDSLNLAAHIPTSNQSNVIRQSWPMFLRVLPAIRSHSREQEAHTKAPYSEAMQLRPGRVSILCLATDKLLIIILVHGFMWSRNHSVVLMHLSLAGKGYLIILCGDAHLSHSMFIQNTCTSLHYCLNMHFR